MKKVRRKLHQQRRSSSTRVPAARTRARATIAPRPNNKSAAASTTNDHAAKDREFDQYYTVETVATYFYNVFVRFFGAALYLMFEPSGGTGSFFKVLPADRRGSCDIDPKWPGIERADFLTYKIKRGRPIAVIGNPPFGKNASLAVRFFNHAAWQAEVIAFIVPRSFRKASIENRLDCAFHLLHEELVPANAFLFRGKPYDVPAVFQIWVRRGEPRALRLEFRTHPDFAFLKTADGADFAIHRVGAKAGQIHYGMTASPKSNYFIKGNVEAVMRQLDFASVVGNVAGNPSLAKSEIIALYREHVRRHDAGR